MKADPGGTWIRIHDRMPDHPKIEALSDRAFRPLLTTWCRCSERLTDGHVPAAPAVRQELITADLFDLRRSEADDWISRVAA